MLGALQLGIMAAFVVVLVPMGMAGWHLSRNKMLFFSGALFITLAIGVHLTPYFPSVTDFVSSVSSVVIFDTRHSCLSLLHDVLWNVTHTHPNTSQYQKSWTWSSHDDVSACDFRKLTRSDASDLLNGSWVVVAGDSQSRFFALSLLGLVMKPQAVESVKSDLFKRHSDYRTVVDEIGLRLDFVWAPYESNLTDLVTAFKRNRNSPDVLIMGSGLWHMLRVTNESDYGVSLQVLRDSVVSLLPFSPELVTEGPVSGSVSVRSPHLFWIGMPTLINSMLNTEEKRVKMTDEMRRGYDTELWKSKILRQSGGPLLMIDMASLSWSCGVRCTIDGMHYDLPVYEAALQIIVIIGALWLLQIFKNRILTLDKMTTKRGKHSQPLWPSLVMKKWLSIQPKVYEYSEEEVDTETESEDDACSLNDARMHRCKTLASRTPRNQPVSSQTSGKHCSMLAYLVSCLPWQEEKRVLLDWKSSEETALEWPT
ncbi:hypothetical protein F8388_011431, partial [Cannabis sativa]